MVYSYRWYLKIQDGKIVIVTGNWVLQEVFAPEDSEIQLRDDAIIFKRREVEGLKHELPFKNYVIERYNPPVEELQELKLVGDVERNLLRCFYDIFSDYILTERSKLWKKERRAFSLDYWKDKYKEYADVLDSVDWSLILPVLPTEK